MIFITFEMLYNHVSKYCLLDKHVDFESWRNVEWTQRTARWIKVLIKVDDSSSSCWLWLKQRKMFLLRARDVFIWTENQIVFSGGAPISLFYSACIPVLTDTEYSVRPLHIRELLWFVSLTAVIPQYWYQYPILVSAPKPDIGIGTATSTSISSESRYCYQYHYQYQYRFRYPILVEVPIPDIGIGTATRMGTDIRYW